MPPQPPRHEDSDEQLLERAAAGDAPAFGAFYRRCQANVYRFALHMTGSRAAADDVTQDVFMIVMREAPRYQPNRSGVAAWLCGIARNCARQRLARDRRLRSFDDEPETATHETPEPDALGVLTRAEGIERVRKAVLRLPVRYREAVVLCDLQELTYTEAADAIGCAVGTVRSRLHRGRQLLAGKLAAATASPSNFQSVQATVHSGPTAARDEATPCDHDSSGRERAVAKLRGRTSWA